MKTQCQTSQIYSSMAGDEDLAELVEVFVGEIPNRIATLKEAADKQDWKSVERFAHQLKGALGSYGFGTVMPFAQDLETIAHDGRPDAEIVAALKQLESMCERISSGSCCE
ncbi:MAG: Hpt domain-containing protein [Pirellulales bacterium]